MMCVHASPFVYIYVCGILYIYNIHIASIGQWTDFHIHSSNDGIGTNLIIRYVRRNQPIQELKGGLVVWYTPKRAHLV